MGSLSFRPAVLTGIVHTPAGGHDRPEVDVDVTGPVGRILDAGVQAYLPARPVEKVAENVQAYLSAYEQRRLTRGAGPGAGAFLMPPVDG